MLFRSMAHARWATCGIKSDCNSHPHVCYREKFIVVHNGIIENYIEIKNDLLSKNITFSSQTDTEVIVNLISYLHAEGFSIKSAIREALSQLEGTWGLVVMCKDVPTKIYAARHGSPLLIGIGENCMMIASEQSGFANYVNNFICLRERDIVALELHLDSGEIEMTK